MTMKLLLLFLSMSLSVNAAAFFSKKNPSNSCTPTSFRRNQSVSSMFPTPPPTRLSSSKLEQFNPFERSKDSVSGVSLRKLKMQQLTSNLLAAASDEDVRLLLEEHQDFLLEPLEDNFAVLDDDSIYTNCTTRADRYRAFAERMTSRIERATHPRVRHVLQRLMEFVLEFETTETSE